MTQTNRADPELPYLSDLLLKCRLHPSSSVIPFFVVIVSFFFIKYTSFQTKS